MPSFITFHHKGVLLSNFHLTDKLKDEFLNNGNNLLIREMRKGLKLTEIKKVLSVYVEVFHHRRTNKKKVSYGDHVYFSACFLALLKLGDIVEDNENGFVITKIKRKKIKTKS